MPDGDDKPSPCGEGKPLCPRCYVPLRVEITAHHLRIFCDGCQREYVKYHSAFQEGWAMPKRISISSSAFLRPVGHEYEFILDGEAPRRLRYRVVGHGEVDAPGDDRLAGKREIVQLVDEGVMDGG